MHLGAEQLFAFVLSTYFSRILVIYISQSKICLHMYYTKAQATAEQRILGSDHLVSIIKINISKISIYTYFFICIFAMFMGGLIICLDYSKRVVHINRVQKPRTWSGNKYKPDQLKVLNHRCRLPYFSISIPHYILVYTTYSVEYPMQEKDYGPCLKGQIP